MQTPPYTPEDKVKGRQEGSRRPRVSSVVSNSSEDGAVFLGKTPPRALTPRPIKRRPKPIQDTQREIATSEEDIAPQSPVERAVLWLENSWAHYQENLHLREVNRILFITLVFVAVRHLTWECPPQHPAVVIRGNVGDSAWSGVHHNHWAMADTDAGASNWAQAAALGADIVSPPLSPDTPLHTNLATSNPGTSAFAIWNFAPAALANVLPAFPNPAALAKDVREFLKPSNFKNSAGTFIRNKLIYGVWFGATYPIYAMRPTPKLDTHGWDVIVANQERRQHFLSVLRDMEEVSSHLHVELSGQLFEGSAQNTNEEQISAINNLEDLQKRLEELKTHQYDIVRLLGIYHKAGNLASSALDDYTLFGNSKPSSSVKDLDSLRSSMLDTGSQLLTHLNAAQQTIDFITQTSQTLPWKTQEEKWWLARWLDRYKDRGIEAAFSGLEQLDVYVN
ncbi:unnamed protein product, partial [Aureobasidium mustum]